MIPMTDHETPSSDHTDRTEPVENAERLRRDRSRARRGRRAASGENLVAEQYAEARGARRRAVRRDQALKRYRKESARAKTGSSTRRMWISALAGVGALVVVGGIIGAHQVIDTAPVSLDTSARPASIPSAPSQSICAPAPRLPAGAGEGEDVQFSPVSSDAATSINVAARSDLAGTIPGLTLRASTDSGVPEDADAQSGQDAEELSASQPEEVQQGEPASAGADGTPVRRALISQNSDALADEGIAGVIAAEPLGGSPAVVAGSSEFTASDGDLHGLSLSGCTPASHQQWLTGADTTIGTTSVLSVTNPSASAAAVDISLYDTDGPVAATGVSGITLAPDQTRSFVLGGLAADASDLAVGISSTGGAVSASIQHHRLDGVDPVGVDTIQAVDSLENRVVIPGIVVDPDNDTAGADPSLSIASPLADASVEVQIVDEDGVVAGAVPDTVDVDTATVSTLDLSELDTGTYSVYLVSDAPVVASGTGTTSDTGPDHEVSSVASAPALGFDQVVPLGSAGDSQLVFTAPEDAEVTVTPIDREGEIGEDQTETIAANTSVPVSFDDDAAGVAISTDSSEVYAAVTTTSSQGISAYPVVGPQAAPAGAPVRIGW